MELEDIFLEQFKELEQELVSIANIREDFVSFSRALNKVYYDRLNPVVADSDIYDFLKTASDLRNILSHRSAVCVPSKEFVDKFTRIVKEVKNPGKCIDVCTKASDLIICHPGNLVSDVVDHMMKTGLSHIPVMSGGKVTGVFSRSTIFDYYAKHLDLTIDAEFTIKDFAEFTTLEGHSNERYLFVSPNTPIYEVFRVIHKTIPKSRRLSVVFVTKNGQSHSELLGIITETDLMKLTLSLL